MASINDFASEITRELQRYSHLVEEDLEVAKEEVSKNLVDGSPNMIADNKVHHKINDITIELYIIKKDLDLVAESKREQVLDDNEIPYESSEVFIDSEKLFRKIYETRLI
ncbi:hypothetical protein [Bacillus sp. C30]|uniref:hypothetical protein n=1 Tax=Bacillus sp. C30 TaxID=1387733 RepID=UPI00349F269F